MALLKKLCRFVRTAFKERIAPSDVVFVARSTKCFGWAESVEHPNKLFVPRCTSAKQHFPTSPGVQAVENVQI